MAEDGIRDYFFFFFFQAEDGIRDRSPSRGLGDVYKRQIVAHEFRPDTDFYISDVEISQFGVTPGFIWTRYPDETMFAQFIEQAVLLTKDRFKGQ